MGQRRRYKNPPIEEAVCEFRWEADVRGQVIPDSRQVALARLDAAFQADSLEDGVTHPAELVIDEALRSTETEPVLHWLKEFCLDAARPGFAASVLRCLGRQTSPGTVSWRVGLVRTALAMNDVGIRDAAIQAAELWADREVITVLESSHHPEPWLRDYIRDVIDDLGP